MLRRVLIGIAVLLVGTLAAAQQTINKVPISDVSSGSGAKMYQNYCAACHGMDGKGNGPAAAALKTSPGDLTTLAQRNGGKFPAAQVYDEILLGPTVAAHGDKDMPVWGSLFWSLSKNKPTEQTEITERASNLTSYVESLQRK